MPITIDSDPWRFSLPPDATGEGVADRLVGVELEFAGLTPLEAASTLSTALGGRVRQSGPMGAQVLGAPVGPIEVELDMALAHQLRREGEYDSDEANLEDWLAEQMVALAGLLAPVEMVASPLPVSRLPELKRGFDALREQGAQGTGDAALYAFGMHLNVEEPTDDASRVWRILSAYALSEDWALLAERPDWSRRLSPFITRYPTSFRIAIAEAPEIENWDSFAELYVAHNPTRNRALDMLPILGFHARTRTEALLQGGVSAPRPAFHYRLPDSRINEADWSPASSWEIWRLIERAAAEDDRLSDLRTAMRRRLDWMIDDEEHVALIDEILA